jgi:hypothetical protein
MIGWLETHWATVMLIIPGIIVAWSATVVAVCTEVSIGMSYAADLEKRLKWQRRLDDIDG